MYAYMFCIFCLCFYFIYIIRLCYASTWASFSFVSFLSCVFFLSFFIVPTYVHIVLKTLYNTSFCFYFDVNSFLWAFALRHPFTLQSDTCTVEPFHAVKYAMFCRTQSLSISGVPSRPPGGLPKLILHISPHPSQLLNLSRWWWWWLGDTKKGPHTQKWGTIPKKMAPYQKNGGPYTQKIGPPPKKDSPQKNGPPCQKIGPTQKSPIKIWTSPKNGAPYNKWNLPTKIWGPHHKKVSQQK